MKPIARQLAEWCVATEFDDIPAEIHGLNPLRVVDTIGLILAGSSTRAVEAARSLALYTGGQENCTLVGSSKRVPSATAALVHGVAAHCHDFDDTFTDSVVHPGSIVIPTALAMAEANSSSSAEFSVAISVGYEVAARLGAVAGRKFHARNMHASGIVGPIAASAVAARLMGLSEERTSWAMGLAASMSSGIRAYAVDGGWSKWLHLGWASHGGITAAGLAARGFRGPEYVFDGTHDLYSALLHKESVDRSSIVAGLGDVWKGAEAEFKYYPCAHVIQPFIDAVLSIRRQNEFHPSDIEYIECTIAPWAAAIVCEPADAKLRFDTELEATGSLPYQVSVAALDGHVGLDALEKSCRSRADVAQFARRVKCRKDDLLGGRFDGCVSISTASGKLFTQKTTLGTLDPDKIGRKFIGLASSGLGGTMQAEAALSALLKPEADWRGAVGVLRDPRRLPPS